MIFKMAVLTPKSSITEMLLVQITCVPKKIILLTMITFSTAQKNRQGIYNVMISKFLRKQTKLRVTARKSLDSLHSRKNNSSRNFQQTCRFLTTKLKSCLIPSQVFGKDIHTSNVFTSTNNSKMRALIKSRRSIGH